MPHTIFAPIPGRMMTRGTASTGQTQITAQIAMETRFPEASSPTVERKAGCTYSSLGKKWADLPRDGSSLWSVKVPNKTDSLIVVTSAQEETGEYAMREVEVTRWLDLKGAARYMSMSKKTIMRLVDQGQIVGCLKGGKWYLDRRSIDAFFLGDIAEIAQIGAIHAN
jgi:hypothetical protein